MEENRNKAQMIANEVSKAVVGKKDIIEKVLLAILAKGHILIEDVPGVGKTTLALAFSKSMELLEHRLQFTPDVMPTDVIGFNIWNKEKNLFEYKPGVVFCNLFLADEINRTSSKTQAALLEVMEEGKVTVDGVTRKITKPFHVIATQNPIGSIGTQMLPESQLDRFMVRLTMGYPDIQSEVNILKGKQNNNPLDQVKQVVSKEELLMMQQMVEEIYVHDVILSYIATLVVETRNHNMIELGVSPRGTIAITNMAKACAFLNNRDYVIPDDVLYVFRDVTSHRIILNSKARMNHITTNDILNDILKQVKKPRIA